MLVAVVEDILVVDTAEDKVAGAERIPEEAAGKRTEENSLVVEDKAVECKAAAGESMVEVVGMQFDCRQFHQKVLS